MDFLENLAEHGCINKKNYYLVSDRLLGVRERQGEEQDRGGHDLEQLTKSKEDARREAQVVAVLQSVGLGQLEREQLGQDDL